MKRIAVFLLVVLLSLTFLGCAEIREAAKEQVQSGKIQPAEFFTPTPGQGWQKVVVFEGKEQGAETVSFAIPDNSWRITWEVTIPKREVGTFSIEIYQENGQLLKEIYKEILYGQTEEGKYSSNEEFAEGKSSFYLKTGTRNIISWKLEVETFSPPIPAELEKEYPYLAELKPELEGKIEVRYNYIIQSGVSPYQGPFIRIDGEWALKNLSDKRIVAYAYLDTVREKTKEPPPPRPPTVIILDPTIPLPAGFGDGNGLLPPVAFEPLPSTKPAKYPGLKPGETLKNPIGYGQFGDSVKEVNINDLTVELIITDILFAP